MIYYVIYVNNLFNNYNYYVVIADWWIKDDWVCIPRNILSNLTYNLPCHIKD